MKMTVQQLKLFRETPIAELEKFGASPRLIGWLDKEGKVFVKHLQGVSPKDLLRMDNVGPKMVSSLEDSLAQLARSLKN